MKKLILFTLSASLYAGGVEFSITKYYDKSTYTVSSADLKSTLEFPLKYNTLDMGIYIPIKNINVKVSTSFLLSKDTTKGEDTDYKNDQVSVYSYSKNILDRYKNYSISFEKPIKQSFFITGGFNYKNIELYWQDTHQIDYVQNTIQDINKRVLTFEQRFYLYSLGILYKKTISKKVDISLHSSYIYGYVDTKDRHILRNFYVKQESKPKGYKVDISVHQRLKNDILITLYGKVLNIKDKSVDMHYYNNDNYNYLTLPSTYEYKSRVVGVGISKKF